MTFRKFEVIGALIMFSVVIGFAVKGNAQQSAPKTPWGEPDLQGIWDHKITTPIERPARYANKEFLTDEEIRALDEASTALPVGKGRDVRAERGSEVDVEGAYNNIFSTGGGHYDRSKRTSLLIDPSDGKIPAITEEGRRLMASRGSNRFGIPGENGDIRPAAAPGGAAPSSGRGGRAAGVPYAVDIGRPNDNPEDRNDLERCRGVTMPCTGGLCGFSRMVQTPGYVSIYYEMGHSGGAYRTIPTDNRKHLPDNVRLWLGDSVGHWEGDTLVVDTTNFTGDTAFRSVSDEKLHMIEKFKRLDGENLQYTITIDKPSMYAGPWTFQMTLMRQNEKENKIYESACYEGNYALVGMLAGQRLLDKEKAAAAKAAAKPAASKKP
jgi:hypothetical protein